MRLAAFAPALFLPLFALACGGAAPPDPAPPKPIIVPPIATADAAPPERFEPPRKAAKYEALVARLPKLRLGEIDRTFNELRQLADPRSADALAEYLKSSPAPHPRAKTLAAFALAELGDERATSTLVWRLEQDPLKLYTAEDERVWSRDDNERVIAARLLSDLVSIHPDHADTIARDAEDAVLAWLASKPQPHSNGMRFLARVRSPKGIAKLAAWADPKEPLPKQGSPGPFPTALENAQSALRYLGLAHAGKSDDKTRALLKKQLARRPAQVDTSLDAMLTNNMAMLGMALRAYATGASQGFAEMGDSKDVPVLVAFAEEPKNNEQARFEACLAIGALATPQQLTALAAKITTLDVPDPAKMVGLECSLEAFMRNPSADLSSVLSPLVAKGNNEHFVEVAKRVLVFEGKAPVSSVKDKATFARELSVVLARSLEDGGLARTLREALPDAELWKLVKDSFTTFQYDSGPGTLTRVVARAKLVKDARGSTPAKRDDARIVLEAMGEEATLQALGFAD